MKNATKHYNTPGGPGNLTQHLVGDYGEARNLPKRRDGLPTGKHTAEANDVADPHPADEEHHDSGRNRG